MRTSFTIIMMIIAYIIVTLLMSLVNVRTVSALTFTKTVTLRLTDDDLCNGRLACYTIPGNILTMRFDAPSCSVRRDLAHEFGHGMLLGTTQEQALWRLGPINAYGKTNRMENAAENFAEFLSNTGKFSVSHPIQYNILMSLPRL